MSEKLNAIEKMAGETSIKNPEKIGEVLNALLEMDGRRFECISLTENVNYRYLIKDIGSGFELDSDLVGKCTVGELLVLIGLEPDVPWYEVDEDEECWFKEQNLDKSFLSANHCFALAQAMLRIQNYEPVVERFLKLNYRAFITYLGDRINTFTDDAEQDYRSLCMKKGMRLNRIFYLTRQFMIQNGKEEDAENIDDTLTIGDVIGRICRNGNFSWMCGNEPLGIFVDRIVKAYKLINYLFMNCIRELAMDITMEQMEDLLDNCSENRDYEHLIELRFRFFYRSLKLEKL